MVRPIWNMPNEDDFITPTSQMSTTSAARTQPGQPQVGAAQANATRRSGDPFPPTSRNGSGGPVVRGTTGWMQGLNQAGIQNSAYDEGAFFRNYGQLGAAKPWTPGGGIETFMTETFNPRFAAAASFTDPSQFTDPEDIIKGQTAITEGLLRNGNILDPAAIVGNTMQALSSVRSIEDLANINPALAAILNSAAANPSEQVGALLNFLEQALAGSMPPDILSSWLMTIQRIGSAFQSQMDTTDLSKGGGGKFDMASFAKYLTGMLGPTLGL